MKHALAVPLFGLIAAAALAGEPSPPAVTTGSLLGEMTDLGRLARRPAPAYRMVQFSSFDRRSTTAEAPGWYTGSTACGAKSISWPGATRRNG